MLAALCLAMVFALCLSSYIALCYTSLKMSTRNLMGSHCIELAETGLEQGALFAEQLGLVGPVDRQRRARDREHHAARVSASRTARPARSTCP